MEYLLKRSTLPFSAQSVFEWHESPGAFQRLNPPWQPVQILEQSGGIEDGAKVTLRVPLGPIGIKWRLAHKNYERGRSFTDYQLSGPFSCWEHQHSFLPQDSNTSILEDKISYKLPGFFLGKIVNQAYFRHELERLFAYRHITTQNDLTLIKSYPGHSLKVAISGASGLVGESLSSFLSVAGHKVFKLKRTPQPASSTDIYWNPDSGDIESNKLEGMDVIINLSGENIASRRWSIAHKNKVINSRIKTTELLVSTISKLASPPKLFLSASAIGIYGDRGNETCVESTSPGNGFLSDVSNRWEESARQSEKFGVRCVVGRIGIVLSPLGGALAKMLTPFKLGVAGPLGDGSQIMSWISLHDLIGAIYHVIHHPEISGAVNLVAPAPVSNLKFTRTLGNVLRRPTLLPAPKLALKLALGEMAEALLLTSTRVEPSVLIKSQYKFLFPKLNDALRYELGYLV